MVELKDLSKHERELIAEVELTKAGKRMLDQKCPAAMTKLKYSQGALLLSEFLGKPIDDLVSEYISDVKANRYEAADKWEMLMKDFGNWLKTHAAKKTPSSSTVAVYFIGAKALLNASVPKSMRLEAEQPKTFSRSIAGITIEDLREVYAMCDERERMFIAVLKDTGISADDMLRLNYGDLKGYEKNDFVQISLVRGKEKVEYTTFAGVNAVEALRAYTAIRRNRGEIITDETPIFASLKKPYGRLDNRSLSIIFYRITKRTHKVISTHRLRKFFESYLALTVRAPVILKSWMGHKVKSGRDIEGRYILPPLPEQMKLYQESYRNIDLEQRIAESERIKAEVEKLLPPELLAQARSSGFIRGSRLPTKQPPKRVSTSIKREKTEHNGGVQIEEGIPQTFMRISEDKLLSALEQGWVIVHKLSNGDLIMQMRG